MNVNDCRCFDDIYQTSEDEKWGVDTELFHHKKCHVFVSFSQNYEEEQIEIVLTHEEADRIVNNDNEVKQDAALREIIIKAINDFGFYPIRLCDLSSIELSNDIDREGRFNAPMRGAA